MKKMIFTSIFSMCMFFGVFAQTIENGVLTAWPSPPSNVVIPSEATSIANDVFKSSTIVSLDLNNVTSVGGSSFQACYSLETISAPNVVNIGNRGFQNCQKVTELSMPKVQEVGAYGIYNCIKLTTVSLPAVKKIQRYAFDLCADLRTVDLSKATGLTTIEAPNTFPDISTLTVYVSDASKIALFPTPRNYTVEVKTETGVTEKHVGMFAFYPNPAKDEIKIQLGDSEKNEKVQILDITGKVLLEQVVTNNGTIKIDHLTKSIYFIRVGEMTQKLILQ